MDTIDTSMLEVLQTKIRTILEAQPSGISEHALLKLLAGDTDRSEGKIFQTSFDSDLSLFQAHFLLFHILHRIKLTLFSEHQKHLDISPLNIQIRDNSDASDNGSAATTASTLAAGDPLSAYYLDLNHLSQTDAKDVEKLLQRFFKGLTGTDTREAALATLGLTDPVDNHTIKKRYRTLAMQHHPDRGGDTQTLQAINQALTQLIP